MKKRIIFGLAIGLTAIVTVVWVAQASVIDAFLMLDGLPAGCGLSQDEQFNGQIIVKSFGQHITHDTDKLGPPTGTSESRGLSILKDPDSCTHMLFLDSVMERDIATMQISFRDRESRVIIAQVTGVDVQIVSGSRRGDKTSTVTWLLRKMFEKRQAIALRLPVGVSEWAEHLAPKCGKMCFL